MKMSYSQNDITEFITLAELAGVHAAPEVFEIIIKLLSLQVTPEELYILLRQISPISPHRKKSSRISNAKE